ncbi:MAG: penicillin-binding protein 2 [Gammaproteobacteria bacterium]|nr:penicillin-binding protein 2 [Gammaproteobacteria bacterium]
MPRLFSAFKDNLQESRLFMSRAITALFVSGLLILALIARLNYLQVVEHEHFRTLSEDNRIKLQPVPPNRGLIYDRNGILLAENLPSYRLEITPDQIKDMSTTLDSLSKLIEIRGFDRERFEKLRRRMSRYDGVPLRFHLSDEEVASFAVNRHLFPGVDIQAGLSRNYPLGSHAAHAVGYVGRINEDELQVIDPADYRGTTHIGKEGIEKAYEEQLHGTVGYEQLETNAQGRALRTLSRQAPIPGSSLYLSLDARLQQSIEKAFTEFNGAAVAVDPRSGEVLAFVSVPGYDPNPFVNGIDYEDYRALNEDPNQPLFNRALRGQYPPGSTIKPFVALAGLELGVSTPSSRTYCPGFYMLPGSEHKYRDWKRGGHGTVDMNLAIVQSCDVYFYDLARSMGIERLHDYLAPFGLGDRTGIDLVGEKPGILPNSAWKRSARKEAWYPGETLISGIGQGFNLTTPLQLAVATATLAAYGQYHTPHMVHALRGPGGALTPLPAAATRQIPINNRDNWDKTLTAMVDVVHSARGTAKRINTGLTYQIGGKTGTAQVYGLKQEEKYDATLIDKKLHDHALFIAFAPADAPRIAVAVVAENGGSGSGTAAPIARTILDRFFEDNPL